MGGARTPSTARAGAVPQVGPCVAAAQPVVIVSRTCSARLWVGVGCGPASWGEGDGVIRLAPDGDPALARLDPG